jgi:hypothetical protein
MIGNLNHTLHGLLMWHIGVFISIIFSCMLLGLILLSFILDLGNWHFMGWCFLSVFFITMCSCTIATDYQARQRIKWYLQDANDQQYGP